MQSDHCKPIQSVERTLDILEHIANSEEACSLTEISQTTGLPKSTVFRIVNVLMKRGYIDRHVSNGRYGLGMMPIEVASHRIEELDLTIDSRPLMLRLHAQLSLTTQLCILEDTQVVYISEVAGNYYRKVSHMGYKRPAHCSSLGKCLLSGLAGTKLNRLYLNYTFVRYTESTICDLESLKSELKIVRERGWAINRGESISSLGSLAACVFDYTGNVVAALSVGGIIELFTPELCKEYLPPLISIALELSHKLGYTIY